MGPHQLLLAHFADTMRVAKLSPVTIRDRIELLNRLAAFLQPTSLLDAAPEDIYRFQKSLAHLSPASGNIYSRHIRSFYLWAHNDGRIEVDPAVGMIIPRVPKGAPHPTSEADLQTLLACTTGPLRKAYILAAFDGLRAGEIARLRSEHLDLDSPRPTAWIQGKGGKERIVPVLPPVVLELRGIRGWVITQQGGRPYSPEALSNRSSEHMRELGLSTTLHSLRHYFATNVVALTHDLLLVRDLLGHSSLSSTQIYTKSDMSGAHSVLTEFSSHAASLLRPQLRIVGDQ